MKLNNISLALLLCCVSAPLLVAEMMAPRVPKDKPGRFHKYGEIPGRPQDEVKRPPKEKPDGGLPYEGHKQGDKNNKHKDLRHRDLRHK